MRLNYLHILYASAGGLIAGFIWFLPSLFGNKWTKLIKEYTQLNDEDLRLNIGRTLTLWIVTCYMNAFVLNVLLKVFFIKHISEAILVSVFMWIGYGLTFSAWPVIFTKQKPALWLINNGAFLLMQITMAIIFVLLI